MIAYSQMITIVIEDFDELVVAINVIVFVIIVIIFIIIVITIVTVVIMDIVTELSLYRRRHQGIFEK